MTGTGSIFAFGPYRLDSEQRVLLRDGKPVPLSPKAALILCILVENQGRIVERAELMRRVWPDAFVEEGNLSVNIFSLRKILAEGLGESPVIETVPKRGYRFVAAARPPSPSPRWRPPFAIFGALAGIGLLAAAAVWAMLPPALPKVSHAAQLTRFGLAEAVASDGPRLFAGRKTGGRYSIVEIPAGGGEPVPFPLPFPNARLLDVSAARREMLFAAFDQPSDAPAVWIVSTGGKPQPRRLGRIESLSARWSPDGNRIAFDSGGVISTAAPDGTSIRKLAEPGGIVDSWSPDSRSIRFTRTNQATGGQSVWEVRADGSGLRPLLPARQMANARWGEGQCCGRWSPDGRYFVFHEGLGPNSTLWAIPERRPLPLVPAAPVKLYAAAFDIRDSVISPDGTRLFLLGRNETHELVHFDRRLRQWVPLSIDPGAGDAQWSPDAQWIAWVSLPDRALWAGRADGSARIPLTASPIQAFGHVWSPDGRRLAYHFLAPGQPGKIAIVPAAGGKPEVLFSDALTAEDDPSWSSDPSHLFFQRSWLDKNGITTASAIFEIDLQSGQVTQLTGTEDLGPPSVSPNGRYMAAQSGDFHALMLFDFHSGKWTQVARGGFIHNPQWTRDSRSIVFQDAAGGEEQPVYHLSLPDLAIAEIAGRRQFLRADVGRFSLSGLTPSGDPVATVIRSNADIYALDLDWR